MELEELELYKFITDYEVEYNWFINPEYSEIGLNDVLVWIPYSWMKYFVSIFNFEVEDQIKGYLQDNCVCIEMRRISEIYDFNLDKVFVDKHINY